MNFLTKFLLNKKNGLFLKILSGVVVLSVLICILNLFQGQVKNTFYTISNPIEKTLGSVADSTSVFFASVLGKKGLVQENEELKAENERLLSMISSLQCEEKKNQTAAEILGLKDMKLVMAGVIGLDSQQDIISIDKGSTSGVLEGMAVIDQKNVLFGKIIKVYNNFSKVMLISNKSSVIDVRVQQDDLTLPAINGVIKGNGGLGVYLDLVPTDQELKEQDILVTSALEGTFPKGLLVGRVLKPYKDDQKPFQQAQAEPFFNIKNTDNLLVVTDYKKEK